jgi:hypothetical protein
MRRKLAAGGGTADGRRSYTPHDEAIMNAILKTILNISVLTCLLVAASSPCFADMSIEHVSKERAKALGMEIRSKAAGPNVVRVELEFKTEGELKRFSRENFSRVELEIREGGKFLVSASLREERPSSGRVVVSFTADRAHLDKITLRVVVVGSGELGAGYELRVKDFVEVHQTPQSNLATATNTVGNAGPSHLSPPASPGKP